MPTDTTTETEALEFALAYEAAGFSVIPANSRQKSGSPFPWADFQSRRATPGELTRWCREYPAHGLAIITGSISQIIVLDLDRHGEDDGVAVARGLFDWEPEGPCVQTGGGGVHAYYRHPGFFVKNRGGDDAIAPGVELRGDGGFVYAPPSVHASGSVYYWDDVEALAPRLDEIPPAPAWLIEEIKKAPAEKGEKKSWARDEWSARLTEGVQQGEGRNVMAAKLAGHYFALGLNATEVGAILEFWNGHNSPPLGQRELTTVLESIGRRELAKRPGIPADQQMSREEALEALSRRFGIEITEIERIGGDDPTYRFHGGRQMVEIPAANLENQLMFRRAMIVLREKVPAKIGPKASPGWDHFLQMMLDVATPINPGEDATYVGVLKEGLQAYLEKRDVLAENEEGDTPEQPRHADGRVWFHLGNYQQYLDLIENVRIDKRRLAQILSASGSHQQKFNVKLSSGRRSSRRLWCVPAAWGEKNE